jgi:ABC-type dipeptide/oligopeptide/nickel transport system permease component
VAAYLAQPGHARKSIVQAVMKLADPYFQYLRHSFILRRLALIVPQVWGISVIVFVLVRLIPGDPAYYYGGTTATPEEIAAIHHRLGLDQPLYDQYVIYLKNLLHGDLGTSLVTSRPVLQDITDRFPATLELITLTLMVFLIVGVPLGAFAARRPRGLASRLTQIYGLVAGSLPDFWWGLVLVFVLFTTLHVAPSPVGQLDIGVDPPRSLTRMFVVDALLTADWPAFISAASHLLLPAFTLAFIYGGPITKHMRTSMTTILNAPYLWYGTMCGLSRSTLLRYAVRNALLPVVTMTGITYIYLISAAVLVETVFSWGGLGQYAVQAIGSSDYNAVGGVVLVTTVAGLVLYLVLDILYAVIDPRIRLA